MARSHGSLNALGFGLLALLALGRSRKAVDQYTAMMLGRPTKDQMETLATQSASERPKISGKLRTDVATQKIEHNDLPTARNAIDSWAGHSNAGVTLWPETPPVKVGQTVTVAVPVGPVSVTGVCKVTNVIDDGKRYGFTYTTLSKHFSYGNEQFLIHRNKDDELVVTITVEWRPEILALKFCLPITRWSQRRAIDKYLAGIAAA